MILFWIYVQPSVQVNVTRNVSSDTSWTKEAVRYVPVSHIHAG